MSSKSRAKISPYETEINLEIQNASEVNQESNNGVYTKKSFSLLNDHIFNVLCVFYKENDRLFVFMLDIGCSCRLLSNRMGKWSI